MLALETMSQSGPQGSGTELACTCNYVQALTPTIAAGISLKASLMSSAAEAKVRGRYIRGE